jgi:hypothetical protein
MIIPIIANSYAINLFILDLQVEKLEITNELIIYAVHCDNSSYLYHWQLLYITLSVLIFNLNIYVCTIVPSC